MDEKTETPTEDVKKKKRVEYGNTCARLGELYLLVENAREELPQLVNKARKLLQEMKS